MCHGPSGRSTVFIAYLLSPAHPGGTVGRLIEAAIPGEFMLLLPEELLDELATKLRANAKLGRRISPEDSGEYIALLRSVAVTLAPTREAIPAVVRDPKDDYLLAYALLNKAGFLITWDKDLLSLERVEQLLMVSPFQFVQMHLV
ncbi:MAG: putative toxin-antitoxin system toxin component, PIN family [Chloroflexota bacterium]|nr:putative toxin-antitoxin system toxin component, PIN family [Chloroflexota bacterium]